VLLGLLLLRRGEVVVVVRDALIVVEMEMEGGREGRRAGEYFYRRSQRGLLLGSRASAGSSQSAAAWV
jgi:hypothetical protein